MTAKKVLIPAAIISVMLISGTIFIFSDITRNDKDELYKQAFRKYYKIFAPFIPENLDFAGEKVPLQLFYVRESLDRELLSNTYFHSNTILLIKRAYRYFPVIEPILEAQGIPDDFKYLALIESSFMNVVSPKGATGFWQFMKNSATGYGLEINDYVDERYHLEKSTEAACKYLKESFDSYKSWTLCAASYNMGRAGISKQINFQKTENYYDLFLNVETSRYVFRILALKLIYSNPVRYGFYLREKDLYPRIPYYEVPVDSTINDLVAFAGKYNINYRLLKEFNPWLISSMLINKSNKKYTIAIPKPEFLTYEKLLKGLKDDVRIFHDTLLINEL